MRRGKREKTVQHYKSSQKILTVGDGDFSFSACLAKAFGHADNMAATSLDSHDTMMIKYGSFETHLHELESRDCTVLFEVDVHDMNKCPSLLGMKFDVIIFNFPHAGHVSWLCESDAILIERHKKLLRGYFKSAREMVKNGGEVHVSHRDDEPYSLWELEKQAESEGFVLKEKSPFFKEHYTGYHQKRGGAIQGNKPFPFHQCPFTFKFSHREHDQEVIESSASKSFDHAISSGDHTVASDSNKKILVGGDDDNMEFVSDDDIDHVDVDNSMRAGWISALRCI